MWHISKEMHSQIFCSSKESWLRHTSYNIIQVEESKHLNDELEDIELNQFCNVSHTTLYKIHSAATKSKGSTPSIVKKYNHIRMVRNKASLTLKEFWNYSDEFAVLNRIIYKDCWMIAPQTLQSEVIAHAHECRQGVDATTCFIHDALYWPGMIADICNIITQCPTWTLSKTNRGVMCVMTCLHSKIKIFSL